ncbi:uncharacterized protein LOC109278961 isoform X3 [Panthera pardus]|uniref:Uncharacterized protein LOC109278961 isoform X3 n=2 Tax=Panthera pardus TaxID=9691 RepID=A0A9W2VYK2_PANPR|nr:uncharacterized protein LOC109278961 isoform X3 [Panthera pardus]
MPEEHHPPPLGETDAVLRAGGGNAPVGSPPFTRQRAQREQSISAANSTILPLRATGPPDAEGNQPYHYWPFATSDLYNWKAQNPKFSKKPAGLIDLLDSVLFTHQPTWGDCQQLLQVLFMTEERERILNEARKLVLGADGNPTTNQAQIDASFPLTRPQWNFSTAEGLQRVLEDIWPHLRAIYEAGPTLTPHQYRPGDWVYVKRHHRETLEPHWKGPYIVVLTTPTALKVDGIATWVHHTHVRPADPSTIRKDFVMRWAVNWDQHNPLKLRL